MSATHQLFASMGAAGSSFPGTQFYVDTDAAGGGNGSIGSPWNHVRSALGTTVNNALSSNPVEIVCVGATGDNLNCTQLDWNNITNCTSAHYLQIRGNNTTGIYNSSLFHWDLSDTNCVYNNLPGYVRLVNLWCTMAITGAGGDFTGFRLSTANVGPGLTDCDCRIIGCGTRQTGAGTSKFSGFYNSEFEQVGTGLMRLWNCISYGGYRGFGAAWSGVTNYNCTSFGQSADDWEDAQVCINCLAGSATGFASIGTGGGLNNYNASADGSASAGANSRVNQTFTFVNSGAGNFQLANNDAGARGFGQNNPASGLFLDDIRGVTRQTSPTAWDIGAWIAAT